MDFLPQPLLRYAEAHTTAESELLRRIDRETQLRVLMPHMISGHAQGRLLALFSKMIQPHCILEIGTFTGYSALCLAEGLAENGTLITLDINEELEDTVRGYFQEAGLAHQIDYRIGNALEIIPELNETFDLVFIDADKHNYASYYDLVFDKVRKGGFIIADNVLWKGKVTDTQPDKDTRNLMDFNTKIQEDPRVQNLLLPLRDGLLIAIKLTD